MSTPTVREHMTAHPHAIDREQPLSAVKKLMDEHRIRHLPVMFGERLVGVISERDVVLVESLDNMGLDDVTAEDAMTTNPYSVGPEEALKSVVARMAQDRIGSAVVVSGGEVTGIFTAIDACRALAAIL